MTTATAITLTLDWPRKALSPNARVHWATLARVKTEYRYMALVAARQVKNVSGQRFPLQGLVTIDCDFYPPTTRGRDIDNLVASLKSGIDGIVAAGILVDDNADLLKWGEVTLKPKAKDARVVLKLRTA